MVKLNKLNKVLMILSIQIIHELLQHYHKHIKIIVLKELNFVILSINKILFLNKAIKEMFSCLK